METISSYLPEVLSFYEVAHQGSFTSAAEKMGLSKGQLSKQVQMLEAILKVQLFHRTTRKVTLTNEGKHFLQYAEGIVKLSREAAESMKEISGSESGLIRITAPNSLGDWFGPELLRIFQSKFPGLKVELDLSNVKRDLVNDGYDFALRAMTESDPEMVARYLGHIKDVIVVNPQFKKKMKLTGSDPLELHEVNCLLNSHQQTWNSWKMKRGKKDFVVEVQGTFACSSYATTKLLCLEGLGVARIPYYLVHREIEAGKLILLYPEYTISTHPLYLVYPSRGYKTQKQKIVRDVILEWIQTQKRLLEF